MHLLDELKCAVCNLVMIGIRRYQITKALQMPQTLEFRSLKIRILGDARKDKFVGDFVFLLQRKVFGFAAVWHLFLAT